MIPYPPNSGGTYNTLKTLKYLAGVCDLTIFALNKGASLLDIANFQSEVNPTSLHVVEINIPRSGINFLRSLIVGVPLAVYRNRSSAAAREIMELLKGADVVIVDHYLMFQYIPSSYKGKVIIVTHNAEFLIWARYAEHSRGWLKRRSLLFEARRIREYELNMCERADITLAFPNDCDRLVEAGAPRQKLVVREALAEEENLTKPKLEFHQTEKIVLFVGTLTWQPNSEGVLWFLHTVWPRVLDKVPEAEFLIAGTWGENKEFESEVAPHPQVKLLGFVDDLETVYVRSRVFAAPLTFGSGVKIKVLNALYRGIPVVTTTCGSEGIADTQDNGMWISDDPEILAVHIIMLLQDKGRWISTAAAARSFAEKRVHGRESFEALATVVGLK